MKLMKLIAYGIAPAMLAACVSTTASDDDDAGPLPTGAGASAGSGGTDANASGGAVPPGTGGSTPIGVGANGGVVDTPVPVGKLEVLSWFSSASERGGFEALTAEFLELFPKLELVHAQSDPEQINARLIGGTPPDVFQDLPGLSLGRWIAYGGDIQKPRVAALDALSKAAGWEKAFPQAVLESVSYGGSVYAVPLDVTRSNVLFFSPALLGTNKQLYTVADLKSAAQELKSKEKQALVFGFKAAFTATLLVFDVMLPGVAGSHFREEYLHGKVAPDDPKFVEALRETTALLQFANADRGELSWVDAVNRVADGDAAMTILGDWGAAPLKQRGKRPGVDFDAIAAPGTAGMFVFGANVFAKPLGAKNPTAADALLGFMATEAGQVAFATKAGSIPARLGVDESAFDPVTQREIQDYQSDTHTLSVSHLLDSAVLEELHPIMRQFGIDGDYQPVVTFLKQKYKNFR